MNSKYNNNINYYQKSNNNKIFDRTCLIINNSIENIYNKIEETTIVDDSFRYINYIYNNISNKISFILNDENIESDK
tara:strand:+ start:935 stop:1165 length:231 start_codon:yes stop_codon:yes gene_type:complete